MRRFSLENVVHFSSEETGLLTCGRHFDTVFPPDGSDRFGLNFAAYSCGAVADLPRLPKRFPLVDSNFPKIGKNNSLCEYTENGPGFPADELTSDEFVV
jgi:hypothetical protein